MGCTRSLQTKNKEIYHKVRTLGKNKEIAICHNFVIRSPKTMEEFAFKIIKVSKLTEQEKKKILNKIDILKKIDHPNIITLNNAYYTSDNKYLHVITEYADGGDLQMKLDEHKEKKEYFNENILLDWFMQICFSLLFIHDKKIIHRNIKPSNIFLMKQNFAKLGDFEVAKNVSSTYGQTKTIVTTLEYSAPEILNNQKYSFEVDIWSLGVTFYQLITLNYPFEGEDNNEIEKNILERKIKEIPKDCKIDKSFIEIINQMMSLNPKDRPTAEQILEKEIIKSRMDCYLRENEYDAKEAKEAIKEYENKNKKKHTEIKVSDEEMKDLFSDLNDKIEANKENKANYDLFRQMTIMNKTIKKNKSM